MKKVQLLFLILSFLLLKISCIEKEVQATTSSVTLEESFDSKDITYKVLFDPTSLSTNKFIKIEVTPKSESDTLNIYTPIYDSSPSSQTYEIFYSSLFYFPIAYFQSKNGQNFLKLIVSCTNKCNYSFNYQQVEMMSIEKSKRLLFLTFDYSDYLLKFEKSSEISYDRKLMVTATGGAKGSHGSKNNVKMELFYHDKESQKNIQIPVNGETMPNGAGSTFFEGDYSTEGNGYFIAKVRAPENTYISFMVKDFGNDVCNNLDIDSYGLYGFLKDDDIKFKNIFKLTENENFNKNDTERKIQVSILAKGELTAYKSSNNFCNEEGEDIENSKITIKDETNELIIFTQEEISSGYKYLCIQNENPSIKNNAYIIEAHDVTDQKLSTIVTEPLVNGFLYKDSLKIDEVRTYRHSKFIGGSFTKYNAKLISGLIKVVYIKCKTFPFCFFDKDIVNGKKVDFYPITFRPVDNFYTANVDKTMEYNAYSSVQYLLTVLCLTEKCEYEVSFSDEEDSLLLKEDIRVAHYISSSSHNYYHFIIPEADGAKKVRIELRTLSGDSNVDISGDVKEKKRYYIQNTEIVEFYENMFTGLYTLNITSSVGSFYLLSYTVFRDKENDETKKFEIGLGVSIIESIKIGNSKKIYKMLHDKTRGKGENFSYVANFYPINCQIKVKFFDNEISSINNIYQHEIDKKNEHYNEDYFEFTVEFLSFNENSTYSDKMCMYYISSQELSENSETIIGEGAPIGFTLTSKTKSPAFLYPHSAGVSDILIKYNVENNYPIAMNIAIGNNEQMTHYFSRSSSYVISGKTVNQFCPNEIQFCSILVRFSPYSKDNEQDITLSIIMKSKDNIPSYLNKNELLFDLVAQNSIQYYIVDLSPTSIGEVVLNFKKGAGKMFAKIVGKNAEPEEGADWKKRVRLPSPEDPPFSKGGEYDPYLHKFIYDANSLTKYGKKVCSEGCELYIGIVSTDEIEEYVDIIDYLEYSILIRPYVDVSSPSEEKRQKLISQAAVDFPSNEYVIGTIQKIEDVHYYSFFVRENCDSIIIEFQSESCVIFINEGNLYPEIDGSAQWTIKSKVSNTIFEIKKSDLSPDVTNLKGHSFKLALKSNNYDRVLSMNYIFRIRVPKKTMKSLIEINSNINTVCNITEPNGYCDLLYPLSEYESHSPSSLVIYSESEIITDLSIFFSKTNSYLFDSRTEEEIENILPREGKCDKSTENQNIKNVLELSLFDLYDEVRIFALISVKSSKPGIVNIYTYMRELVLSTSINGFSNSFYNRKNKPIEFKVTNDRPYTFHITSIDGEGEAYFINSDNKKEEIGERVKIEGSGSLISLPIPKEKEGKAGALIIQPKGTKGIQFLIGENIFPTVRTMEKIKFGFSGKMIYSNEPKFPIIYYMKILDENENININLHLKNISSTFEPGKGNNYTDIFDIGGYIVDESMIISMMRNERINPSLEKMINGRYDQSITTAKLYISSSQIKAEKFDSAKYIIVSLKANDVSDSVFSRFLVDITIMPFSNLDYNSPYDLYINGNLLRDTSSKNKCNYHRLRTGKQFDKYMYIEFSKISSKVNFIIRDLYNKEIKFIEPMTEKFGKYTGVIELYENNVIILEVCIFNSDVEELKSSSTNYVFKVKSDIINNFHQYTLISDVVKFNYTYSNNNKNLNKNDYESKLLLNIPKIVNYNKTKSISARYTVRIFSKYSFDKNDITNTIAFISYYPYSTYIYDYYGKDDKEKQNEENEKYNINENDNINDYIKVVINNFPRYEPYYVSVIGVTMNNDEIFTYQQISDPAYEPKKENEKENDDYHLWYILLIFLVGIIVIIIFIFAIIFIKMTKRKMDLAEQVKKISMRLTRGESNEDEAENQEILNEDEQAHTFD